MAQIAAPYDRYNIMLKLDHHSLDGVSLTVPLYDIIDSKMCKDTFAKNMPSSKVYEEFSKLVFKKDD